MIINTSFTKVYGGRFGKKFMAVDNLQLNVPENAMYGLLGPNGAGKTTTIGMLTTLIPPTSGDASVYGFSVVKQPHKVREVTGLMPQDADIPQNRTSLDIVTYYGRLKGMAKDKAHIEASNLLEDVGIGSRKNDKIKSLSHGMVKLTQIAQALIGKPKVIILDEPTAGLDPKVVYEIRKIIKSLTKNATVIFSSHNLDEVQRICNYVGILDKGKLVEEGKTSKLLSKGKTLEKLFIEKVK